MGARAVAARAIDPAVIATVQAGLAASESEGQRRMRALHNGTTTDLEIAPNLWAGVGLVRGGAGTALVGSHEEVADASPSSSCPATRTWKRHGGWVRACCRSCDVAGCGPHPAPPKHSGHAPSSTRQCAPREVVTRAKEC